MMKLADIDWTAEHVTKILAEGTEMERYAVHMGIVERTLEIDYDHLRKLIHKRIMDEFYPGRSTQYYEEEIGFTHTWLISTLPLIAGDDQPVHDLIRQYFEPGYEENQWVLYWLLDGLIKAEAPDLLDIARKVYDSFTDTPLVSMVGLALLAKDNRRTGGEYVDNMIEALDSRDKEVQWGALRALRLVPLQDDIKPIRQKLGAIVERGEATDATYDAIVALGSTAPKTNAAEDAADSLRHFITVHRRSPLRDGERLKAINGLGNLLLEKSGPVLLAEVGADNPAIAREAAIAIEKVMGVRRATARIVEACTRAGIDRVGDYGTALRWMRNRAELLEELEASMLSGAPEEQEVARRLLSEIGGLLAISKLNATRNALGRYQEAMDKTEDKINDSFTSAIKEARTGFRWGSIMDWVVFSVGMFLIVVTALQVIVSDPGSVDDWVGVGTTGSMGVLGILYSTLIANPRKKIQTGVDNLMQLQIIFLAYVRQLHHIDQAYSRRLLEQEPLKAEEVDAYSDMLSETMDNAIDRMLEARLGIISPEHPAATDKS